LSVAESFDALMSDRPYRPALSPRGAEVTISEGAGKQWDPRVVEHFMASRSELYPIFRQVGGIWSSPTVVPVAGTWGPDSSPAASPRGQPTAAQAIQETVQARGP